MEVDLHSFMFLTVYSFFQDHRFIFQICDCLKVDFLSWNSEKVFLVVNKVMCSHVRLQEGKPRNLTTISDRFSTNADINSINYLWFWRYVTEFSWCPRMLSSIQMMTEVHWEYSLDKNRMFHKIIKIIDFLVVCLVMLFLLWSGFSK